MNIIKKSSLLTIALLMILASCREDVIDIDTTQSRPDPTIIIGYKPDVQTISSSLIGHVTNEQNEDVDNATVTMGAQSTRTNEYGHFFFKNVEMNAKGTYVQIEKQGYFKGSRRFYPVSGNVSNVSVELLEKIFTTTFESNAGAVVSAEKGGTVEFAANAIVDEANAAYDGQVRVAARWLNPTLLATIDQMPGDLSAVNELNEEVALATFGMMAVELETPGGMPLNVAENAAATLTFPVPAEILGQAPAEIPLWYFNERYGIWAQDGTATLQGNEYVGTVNHFTFWNCDVPFDLINFNITLVDENEVPLLGYLVKISRENNATAKGRVDYQGKTSGKIPANEVLKLEVFSLQDILVHTESIGPFSQDASLGQRKITRAINDIITTVVGELLNCDGERVNNGLVVAEIAGRDQFIPVDGQLFIFNFTTGPSSLPVKITCVDLDNPGRGVHFDTNVGRLNDLEEVMVCSVEDLPNTVSVTVEGVTHVYENAVSAVAMPDTFGTYFECNNAPDVYCNIGYHGTGLGLKSGGAEFSNINLGWNFVTTTSWPVIVEANGQTPGDRIVGSFHCKVLGEFNGYKTATISFNFIRE